MKNFHNTSINNKNKNTYKTKTKHDSLTPLTTTTKTTNTTILPQQIVVLLVVVVVIVVVVVGAVACVNTRQYIRTFALYFDVRDKETVPSPPPVKCATTDNT